MEEGAGVERGDAAYMRLALELAERGWGRVAPNPLVGSVVVRDGELVGRGWHREFGAPHAEVEALRDAGERARGATLYVTLEPCSHHGKTGPCTEAVLQAGIARVVFACKDPNPVATGGGATLTGAGVDVVAGVEEASARALNAPFFRVHERGGPARPWTELKLALSLDGRVADHLGRSNWITGEDARAEVHRLRAGYDAIAVGVGTVIADDPQLTVRGPVVPRTPPVRVVFDRTLRVPLESRLVRSCRETPLWIVCSPAAPPERRAALQDRGARVIEADDLEGGFRALRQVGIASIFCEGGAQFGSAALRAALVDRLTLFYAPLLLGAAGADPFRDLPSTALAEAHRWQRRRTRVFGPDTLISMDR
jgi:diaminohydroxyphosphoribosylaminopyrimidine deaminase / 5-amino-6-(5-phosphoribosylamino)uracil reductase